MYWAHECDSSVVADFALSAATITASRLTATPATITFTTPDNAVNVANAGVTDACGGITMSFHESEFGSIVFDQQPITFLTIAQGAVGATTTITLDPSDLGVFTYDPISLYVRVYLTDFPDNNSNWRSKTFDLTVEPCLVTTFTFTTPSTINYDVGAQADGTQTFDVGTQDPVCNNPISW